MLYQGDCLVIFYGSNSWSYTRLARINSHNAAQLKQILQGASTITLSLK